MWTTHSALFPHRQRHAPRGFILPRFVNVDRHHPAATVAMRSTSKNLQESGHSLRPRLTAAVRKWRGRCPLSFCYVLVFGHMFSRIHSRASKAFNTV